MKTEDMFVDSASRRSFLLGLAAAAALPALPAVSPAQAPEPAAAASAPAPESPGSPEIASLMAIVNLRYGSYLKSDEIAVVQRALERQRTAILALRKVPIHNWDAPDCLFIPDGR
jgi:hypothetical protein